MVHASVPLPSRISVRLGSALVDAVPVRLRGQEASLVLDATPGTARDVRLLVDWDDGRTTELGGRVRRVEPDTRTWHVDLYEVAGDWRPFLDYLGSAA